MEWLFAVVILLLIILAYFYKDQIIGAASEALEPEPQPEKKETKVEVVKPKEETPIDWNDVIKQTDLDPSTFDNHNDFIKETRRYSSGANFTSTTDDNISQQMVNFVGLRRPSSVPISPGRRQVEDLQYDVFDRNKEKEIRWGQGVYIRHDDGQYNE